MQNSIRLLGLSLLSVSAFAGGSISTDKTSYLVLEKIIVNFSGLPGNASDWITVVPATTPDTSYAQNFYTGGKVSGQLTFDPQEPGTYEARLYNNWPAGGYTVHARARFTVSYPTPSISLDKAAYAVLEKITVRYSNLPGYANDYVTLVPKGTPDSSWGAYFFTNGAKSGTMVFEPVEPGEWEARVLFRNEKGPVRARTPFTVSYPVPTVSTSKPNYALNEKITVLYSNMPGYPTDYVTVVAKGTPDNSWGAYVYTSGARNGTVTFDAQPAGQYEARVLFRNERGPVRARSPFSVGAECTISLSAAAATLAASGGSGELGIIASTADCAWTVTSDSTWLTFSPASGKGSGKVNYAAGANPGSTLRTGVLTVAGKTLTVSQPARNTAAPVVETDSVTSAADGSPVIAAGSLVSIRGQRLAETSALAPAGTLSIALGGVSVDVECHGFIHAAPIAAVSPEVVTIQLPYEAVGAPVRIRVRTAAGASGWVEISVASHAPRVLAVSAEEPTRAAAYHSDGVAVSPLRPARSGETVTVQVTGLGPTSPPAPSGSGSGGNRYEVPGVSVRLGDQEAASVGAILGPSPGLYLVSFVVPETSNPEPEIVITVEGVSSQPGIFLPSGEAEIILSQNWNPDACSLTDSARFRVPMRGRLTRLTGWYRWQDGETSVGFRLVGAGEVASGELIRGGCDPYQTAWCEATARLRVDLDPGQEYEVRTARPQLCRNARSGENGFIQAWGTLTWEQSPPATLGVEGGLVETEGFHLTIPPGVLAQPATVRVGRLPGGPFKVEGLTPEATRGATLELDIPAGTPVSGKFLVVIKAEDEVDRGPMVLPAEVIGGRARVVFPDPGGPATSTALRSEAGRPQYLVDPNRITSRIRLLANYSEEKSDEGHFIIHYPAADINDPYMDQKQLARMLELAYRKLGDVLPVSRRSSPVDAYVFSFAGAEGQAMGFNPGEAGASETNIWGRSNLGLTLNRDLVADPAQTEQVKVTAGHELFHVFQSLWDPRPWPRNVLHSEWLWFQEASATWFERKMASNPSAFTPENTRNYRAYMLERGLDYIPGSTTLSGTSYARHGYGAASFIEYLYPAGIGDKSVGSLVEMMGERSGIISKTWLYSPAEAIKVKESAVLPLKWREYLIAFAKGDVYPGLDIGALASSAIQVSSAPEIRTYVFKTDSDMGPGEDVWKSQDLSAKLYVFEFQNRKTAWKDTTLKLTLTDPGGDAEMLVFKPNGSKGVLLGRSQKEYLVRNLEQFAAAGTTLYVIVANGRAVSPFTATTDIRLNASSGNDITMSRWLSAGIHGRMADSGGQEITSLQYSDGNPTRPECVLSWSGLSFRQDCRTTGSTPIPNGTEAFEGVWTATGEIASDRTAVKNLTCRQTGKTTTTVIGPDGKTNTGTKEYGVEMILGDVRPRTGSDDSFEFVFSRTANAASSVSGVARNWNIETYAGTTTRLEYKPVRVDSVYVIFRIPQTAR